MRVRHYAVIALILLAAADAAADSNAALEAAEAPAAIPAAAISHFTLDFAPNGLETGMPAVLDPLLMQRLSAVIPSMQGALAKLPAGQRVVIVRNEHHAAFFPSRFHDGQTPHALMAPLQTPPGMPSGQTAHIIPTLANVTQAVERYLANNHSVDALETLSQLFHGLRVPDSPADLHAEMRIRWIGDEEFRAAVRRHWRERGPILGRMPEALIKAFGSERNASNAIDQIADLLHTHAPGDPMPAIFPQLQVSYVNSGSKGDVYRIKVGGQSFVLKIYRQGSAADEFRAATFFEAMGARDSMRSYAAGTSGDAGNAKEMWLLSEWIDPDRPLTITDWGNRGSRWMYDVAEEHGIYVTYSHDRIQAVQVDFGDVLHATDAKAPPSQLQERILYLRMGLMRALGPLGGVHFYRTGQLQAAPVR